MAFVDFAALCVKNRRKKKNETILICDGKLTTASARALRGISITPPHGHGTLNLEPKLRKPDRMQVRV
jgi:hypothetical protein